VKVVSVTAGDNHTLAVAGDVSVYVWGVEAREGEGAIGLGPLEDDSVETPLPIPALRVACGL
jgi:alpha-tubulin suppressor-like RCC1 family protein